MAQAPAPPSSTNTGVPFKKMKIKNSENKKFPELLNYPKRICNNPNPNLAMLL